MRTVGFDFGQGRVLVKPVSTGSGEPPKRMTIRVFSGLLNKGLVLPSMTEEGYQCENGK
jgi:hypothetical protein